MTRSHHFDHILLFVVVALMGIGLVMVYSASSVASLATMADGLYYFKRQLVWVITGLLAMLGFSLVPYQKLEKLAVPLLGFSVFLLILVLIPGVARDIGGARRWLRFGGIGFQPSEFAKICFVIYIAHSISMHQDRIKNFWHGLLPDLAIAAVLFALIYKEPNLSTAALILGTYLILYFLGNGSLAYLSALGAIGISGIFLLIFQAGYRIRRLMAFLDPWENAQTSGYHIIQSLVAIGSGGFLGLGLGQSRQKFFILPERHTDFIFAIICEELGMIGGIVVLAIFFALIWRGVYIATRAPDNFGFLLASGITAIIGLQVVVNIGVVLSLMPTTGITLPFISYGGSSLLFLAIGMGILLNISRYGSVRHTLDESRATPFSGQFNDPLASGLTRRR
ncbi:MAG: putative lipid II flippase FtsW [Candidatus Riflebacteria bacterium HGW-Riflebacteria-2]|jgi:cell division protein FtsW|nr:MAG: putative lipid II flippase FtsW [Candidatus Riflebacteria bacterium HGW-Riflebacteria-2]